MTIAELKKKFKEIAITERNREIISTGIFMLDHYLFVCGGLPCGCATEIFGEPHSGKTTLGLVLTSYALKQDVNVIYVDDEKSFFEDPARLTSLDVDPKHERLLVLDTHNLEQSLHAVLETVDNFKNSKDKVLIIIDSIAVAPTLKELETLECKDLVATRAKVIAPFIRKMIQMINETNISFLVFNQTRDRISTNPMLIGQKTTPGGEALKFWAGIRIGMTPGKAWEVSGKKIGININFKLIKSRYCLPPRTLELRLDVKKGFDEVMALINYAEELELLQRSGRAIMINGEKFDIVNKELPIMLENIIREYIKKEGK
jgi:recombination protein RecA